MSRRITIIGLAAICALAFAAISASGASAAETTAWTCVEGGSGGQGTKFSNADCSVSSAGGAFGHVEIPVNTSTSLKLNTLVPPVLKTIIAGASVTLEATGVECLACTAANKGSAGSMEVSGSGGKLKFIGVTVASSPTKCEVVGGSVTTNELKVASTGTAEATISPLTGTALATFTIAAKAGQTCAVAGPVTVNGDANGTLKGSFLTVNVPTASKTLTVGVNGASLTGEATVEAGTGGTFHPAALT